METNKSCQNCRHRIAFRCKKSKETVNLGDWCISWKISTPPKIKHVTEVKNNGLLQ